MALRNQFFDRLRARRSVLERSRRREGLPELLFYVDGLPGTGQRRLLDTEGKEQILEDKVLESHYRLSGGGKAKKLIDKHWSKEKPVAQVPYVAPKSDPEPSPAKAKAKAAPPEKKAKAGTDKKPVKKSAKKKSAKKTTKKVAKKTTKKTSKKASKKTTKKKAGKKR